MAQSVEQLIRNQQVAGSSPASSSIKKEDTLVSSFFICVPNNWTDLRVGAVLWEQNALPSKKLWIENVCGKVGN